LAAYAKSPKSLDLTSRSTNAEAHLRIDALYARSVVLRHLGRHAEAQADLAMVFPDKVIFELASESDLKGWTLKGNAFSVSPHGGLFLQPTLNSVAASGERATGSALSPPFRVGEEFEYVDAVLQGGKDEGQPGEENLVLRFLDADSGAVFDQLLPPGTHELRTNRVSTTNLSGKLIRLLLVDHNTNSAYAWIGLRQLSLIRRPRP
jgi:hypothetical protein